MHTPTYAHIARSPSDVGVAAQEYSEHRFTHRPQSSSVLGLPSRIKNMNPKKELLWGLWVSRVSRWCLEEGARHLVDCGMAIATFRFWPRRLELAFVAQACASCIRVGTPKAISSICEPQCRNFGEVQCAAGQPRSVG